MIRIKYLILITILAFIVRFVGIGNPNQIVFDEVAGMTYGLHVLYQKPYFDVHPPLLAMLYSAWISPFSPSFVNKIENNDKQWGNYPYLGVRSMTALAGVLVVVLGMLIGWKLYKYAGAGLIVGLGLAIDNAMIVMSRYMLPDVWLLLFGLGAVAVEINEKRWRFKNLVIGFLLAACVSVKWTGWGFGVVLLGFMLAKRKFKEIFKVFGIGLACYVGVWVLFFNVVSPQPVFSGIEVISDKLSYPDGKDLMGVLSYIPSHHLRMFDINKLLVSHVAASTPGDWIFGGKKIVMYTGEENIIVLLGNLVSWWSVLLAVIWGGYKALKSIELRILLVGYLVNIIPFLVIERIFFIYHYLPALSLGYLMLAGVLVRNKRLTKLWLITVTLGFLLIMPVTYGWNFPMWWIKPLAN